MKVTLNWLREFAPFDQSPALLGDTMSDLGMAVEDVKVTGSAPDGVVVARVVALRPHPDADRIQLVDVDAGDGNARQVCCGAFNLAVGDLVPFATIGTRMPDGLEIAARMLRGEISNGMLCSARELELGDDAAGIMILPADAPVGVPLGEALGWQPDVVWDLEVNANRPDAMSVAGVARDVAARLGIPFAIPEFSVAASGPTVSDEASVEIVDPVLCGRFLARTVHAVAIGPSPRWLAARLVSCGMRPINSVVDVSNYVMLELGQPNHTYDLALVPRGHIRVRRAHTDERLVTLDGVERRLVTTDGVIADGSDVAIGVAGVMGGASTEISEATTDVLVELAWWRPEDIARTSTRLQLRSEASLRFERGTDPEALERAAARFCQLLEPTGAVTTLGVIDERGEVPPRDRITVRTERVNSVLGTDIAGTTIAAILRGIEFEVDEAAGDLSVVPPSFRPDTSTEIDVVEEVARHHGYQRILRTVPRSPGVGGLTPAPRDRRLIQDTLVGAGLDEAMPMPFLDPDDATRAGLSPDAVRLANPLAAEESVLRNSLRPGLLTAIAFNVRHRNEAVGLFEIGRVFIPAPDERLPNQPEMLGVIAAAAGAERAVGAWHLLVDALALPGPAIENEPIAGLHPGRSGRLRCGEVAVGHLGEIHPEVAARFAIPTPIAWLSLDLEVVAGIAHGERRYEPVSRQPSSDIDLAFDVSDDVPAAAVEATLRDATGPILTRLTLFDVFRGDGTAAGRRSLAFGLRLQAADHTLDAAELAEVRQRAIDAVTAAHDAILRG